MEHDEVYNPHFNLTLENPLMELKAVPFFNVCLCNIFIFLFRETAKLLQEAAEIKVKH